MMTSMGPQDLKSFATFICLCLTRSRSRQQKKINDTIENVQHTFGAGRPVYLYITVDRPTECDCRTERCAHLASNFNR